MLLINGIWKMQPTSAKYKELNEQYADDTVALEDI